MPTRVLTLDDVRTIPADHLPLLVLSSTLADAPGVWGLVGFLIQRKTHGEWNHAMWMHKPGMFASQQALFSEVPCTEYINAAHHVKFLCGPWSSAQRAAIQQGINASLARPWWRRLYDEVGVVGQLFNLRRINIPWREYCSENAVRFLALADQDAAKDMGAHPSPEDINRWAVAHPDRLQTYGVWDTDMQTGGVA